MATKATEKKPCQHKTTAPKKVTVKGVTYKQTVCKTCGHVLRSEADNDKKEIE